MHSALVAQTHVGAMRKAGKRSQSELAATKAPVSSAGMAIRLVRIIVEDITVCTCKRRSGRHCSARMVARVVALTMKKGTRCEFYTEQKKPVVSST